MSNELPIDRETFINADDRTYRGMEYDLHEFHARNHRQWREICDKKFVPIAWLKGVGIIGMLASGIWAVFRLFK